MRVESYYIPYENLKFHFISRLNDHTQIEYLGSFIPYDQALNMAVIYAFQWVNDDFQLLFNDNPRIQIY